MTTKLLLPVLNNTPMASPDASTNLGPLELRYHAGLDFIENSAFNISLLEYDERYQNSQSYSTSFQAHMEEVANLIVKHTPIGGKVVEVGCGKGEFISLLRSAGDLEVEGYDATYEGDDQLIHRRYITADDRITADLVVIRHVLEHIHEPFKFLLMLKKVFGQAKIYIEVPDLDYIRDAQTFYDITYEHVNYFTKKTLLLLFGHRFYSCGNLFGDQYQYVVTELNSLDLEVGEEWKSSSWRTIEFDALFPKFVDLVETLDGVARDRDVYVWGAAGKGCIFLTHCKRLSKLIDSVRFAVDLNPNKHDKYLPGSGIEVKSPEAFFLVVQPGALVVVTNPMYLNEIEAQIKSRGPGSVEIACLGDPVN